MDIILYILLFFLFIILLIILIPIHIVLSSDKGMIDISYGRLFSAGIFYIKDKLVFIYRIPFWKKEVEIIDQLATPRDTSVKKKESKGKKNRKFSNAMLKRIRNRWKEIFQTFKVEKLELNIDTDDYMLNAYLFPLFHFLGSKYNRPLSTNFTGLNRIEVRLTNRLAKLLYALWK